MEKINIEINNKKYLVEVAKTEEEKEKGLQGRTELDDSEGMLFDFSNEVGDISMWMKDTLIPLDIIFINDDQVVTYVGKGVPNTKTKLSVQDTAYVLEVNTNSGIKEGDELDFIDNGPVMKVLAQDGSTQMELWGGERIVSRRETKILIKKAKKAQESNKDSDYMSLGRYIFKVFKGQDTRPAEYVNN